MFLTGRHMSRRTALRGLGVTIALPFLDSMIPARSVFARTPAARIAGRTRLVCIEQVHGAAGCRAGPPSPISRAAQATSGCRAMSA